VGGFLPLLEAFAAFALTMVALTTAVSTILGIIQRALRWRSAGMRLQLVYFFRNGVKTLLYPASAADSKQKWTELERELPQFLADLSFQPSSDASDDEDPRLKYAVLPERPSDRFVPIAAHWLRFWSSLKRGLDSLPPDEFVTRLKASHLYTLRIAPRGAAAADALVEELKARFIAHGQAATDRFTRASRTGTLIIGFLLAFGLNIDAYTLLGRYLTDPKLTADVLQQRATILDAADNTAITTQAANSGKLDEAAKTLDQAAKAIGAAGSAASQSQIEDIQKMAKALHDKAQVVAEDVQNASEAVGSAAEATTALRATLANLSDSFPIGWTLYPACTNRSTDARCITALHGRNVTFASAYQGFKWIACNDTAGFLRWFAGTLILGLMLGLGTPFWIEVVNNFLRARDLITNNRKEKPKDDDGAPAGNLSVTPLPTVPPSAPPAAKPAGGGRSVF